MGRPEEMNEEILKQGLADLIMTENLSQNSVLELGKCESQKDKLKLAQTSHDDCISGLKAHYFS